MMRFVLGLVGALAVVGSLASASWAVDPHFTACVPTTDEAALTITGKVAGLGKQTVPLHLEATAVAMCVDLAATPLPVVVAAAPVSTTLDIPPPKGQAKFALSLEALFVPPCDPPLTVVFADVEVCDTTHGICCTP